MVNFKKSAERFGELYQALELEGDLARFSKAVNKLLGSSFIIHDKKGDAEDYRFCLEHREMFERYFDVIEYTFDIDRNLSVAYIKTDLDRNRVRLKKVDTAILLIIRKLFYKKYSDAPLSSSKNVYLSVEEIKNELITSGAVREREVLTAADKEALRKLRTHKIIDFEGSIDAKTKIEVYPSIQIILPGVELEEIEAKLAALKKAEKGESEESDDEETDED